MSESQSNDELDVMATEAEESADTQPTNTKTINTESAQPDRTLENHMEQVFLADRQTTTRLGWIAMIAWGSAMALLTAGGLLAMLARQHGDEGLRLALVAISIPGLFCLVGGVVASVLWSRRSQRLTLESLQQRLAQIETLLRD